MVSDINHTFSKDTNYPLGMPPPIRTLAVQGAQSQGDKIVLLRGLYPNFRAGHGGISARQGTISIRVVIKVLTTTYLHSLFL